VILSFPQPDAPPVYRLKAILRKGTSTRLYEIRPFGDGWQTWVRRNGQPHRAEYLYTLVDLERLRGEYEREITDLIADGWIHETTAVLVWGR
jgi:hypothetical protein